jgi:hypothetical protein
MDTKPQNDNARDTTKPEDKREKAREVHTHGSRRADAPRDRPGGMRGEK